MSTDRNMEVVREFTRIFKNEHNVDGVDHLFHPEFTHNFRQDVPPGLEGFKVIGRIMNGTFPDVHVTEEDLIAGGDRVVERSSAKATHLGGNLGVAPTERTVDWDGDPHLPTEGREDHPALGGMERHGVDGEATTGHRFIAAIDRCSVFRACSTRLEQPLVLRDLTRVAGLTVVPVGLEKREHDAVGGGLLSHVRSGAAPWSVVRPRLLAQRGGSPTGG